MSMAFMPAGGERKGRRRGTTESKRAAGGRQGDGRGAVHGRIKGGEQN